MATSIRNRDRSSRRCKEAFRAVTTLRQTEILRRCDNRRQLRYASVNARADLDGSQSNHFVATRLSAAVSHSYCLRALSLGAADSGARRTLRWNRWVAGAAAESEIFDWRLPRSHRG